jgi:hypothetical protein
MFVIKPSAPSILMQQFGSNKADGREWMDRRFHGSHDIGFTLGCRICLLHSLPYCCICFYDLVFDVGFQLAYDANCTEKHEVAIQYLGFALFSHGCHPTRTTRPFPSNNSFLLC